MATALGVAYFQYAGDIADIAKVLAVFISGQVIEGNFVTPKLVGDKVELQTKVLGWLDRVNKA